MKLTTQEWSVLSDILWTVGDRLDIGFTASSVYPHSNWNANAIHQTLKTLEKKKVIKIKTGIYHLNIKL